MQTGGDMSLKMLPIPKTELCNFGMDMTIYTLVRLHIYSIILRAHFNLKPHCHLYVTCHVWVIFKYTHSQQRTVDLSMKNVFTYRDNNQLWTVPLLQGMQRLCNKVSLERGHYDSLGYSRYFHLWHCHCPGTALPCAQQSVPFWLRSTVPLPYIFNLVLARCYLVLAWWLGAIWFCVHRIACFRE